MTEDEKQTKARWIVNILKDTPHEHREEVLSLVQRDICFSCGSTEGRLCQCWNDK